jgi:hypothetical protein
MKKFVALGTECAEYLKVAKASEGELFSLFLLVLFASSCCLFDFSFPFFAGLQMLWHQPMPALHRWKPSSVLREKPMTLQPPLKQVLRSRINRHWLR